MRSGEKNVRKEILDFAIIILHIQQQDSRIPIYTAVGCQLQPWHLCCFSSSFGDPAAVVRNNNYKISNKSPSKLFSPLFSDLIKTKYVEMYERGKALNPVKGQPSEE